MLHIRYNGSALSTLHVHAQPDGGVAKTILVEGQGYDKPETGDEVTGELHVQVSDGVQDRGQTPQQR